MTVDSHPISEDLTSRAKPQHTAIFVLVATFVAFAPVFIYGFPSDSWDVRFHSLWTRHFSDQLWAGELYPRWISQMNDGLGSPHFFYYPPLAYYVASLFQGFRTPTALAQLSIASTTLLFLSGLACYRWLLGICGRAGALIGTCFYLTAPFHVFVDAYVRGDYAEFASYFWFPVMLYGVELMRSRRSIGFAVAAVGYAGLVLTHIVIGLVYSGVPFVYALGRFEGQRSRAALALVASLVGLVLASVYLLPALTTQSEVNVPMADPVVLVFDVAKPNLLFFIDVLFVAYGITLAGAGMMMWILRGGKLGSFEITLVILCTGVMVLMTGVSRPIWDLLPVLRAVQFSYRFNTVIDLGLAGLFAAAATDLFRQFGERRVLAAAVGAFFMMALAADAYAVHFGVFDFDAPLWRQRVAHSPDYGKFRPFTVHDLLPADKLPLWSGGSGLDADVPPIQNIILTDSSARAEVVRWRPRDICFSIDAAKAGTAVIAQLYYPGWQAVSAKTRRVLPVRPSDDRGFVAVDYDAGTDEITLRLTQRPVERIGWLGSGLGAIVLVMVMIVLRRSWDGKEGSGRAAARPISG